MLVHLQHDPMKYIKVHTATRWTIRHSLMLLWFANLMNVTEEVTIHRPNVSTLLSSAFIHPCAKLCLMIQWLSLLLNWDKISAKPHTIVKQICFSNGNVLFLSLFSLSKNWMHNVVYGAVEKILICIKRGSEAWVVQWSVCWTLGPTARVQVLAGAWRCVLKQDASLTLLRLLG